MPISTGYPEYGITQIQSKNLVLSLTDMVVRLVNRSLNGLLRFMPSNQELRLAIRLARLSRDCMEFISFAAIRRACLRRAIHGK